MYSVDRPLEAILNPPDLLSGMPGDFLKLSVVVQNLGEQDAVIDVYLDDTDQIPSQWCAASRQRLALAANQSEELVFAFTLPPAELPGAYDYAVVIDAPEHYPNTPPSFYPQQMRVLLREQTVIRMNDPSFFLNPATNTQRPARLQPGQRLAFQVRIDNRSDRVDKFRLTCLDLDEDWFTIRYRGNPLASAGLLAESSFLELNPQTQGDIQLELHPPIETLAGVYSPTFQLHSDNQPQLVLLDLIYVDIHPVETLAVELEAIVSQVSHSTGQYRLKLQNLGNVIRQLSFSASGRDEEELCTYVYEPTQIRLSPTKEAQAILQVTPHHKWRRPFLGSGQVISFQVEMQDQQGYKLPERLPQGSLIWKARPWWQFLLLLLAVLGLLGGIGFLIWLLFFKPLPPPVVAELSINDTAGYREGDSIQLSWTIHNFKQVKSIELSTRNPNNTINKEPPFDFRQGIPTKLKEICQVRDLNLICRNYFLIKVGIPGKYVLELKAIDRAGNPVPSKTKDIEVAAKPDPKITKFQIAGNAKAKVGDPIKVTWEIGEIEQMQTLSLTVIDNQDNSAVSTQAVFQDNIVTEPFQSQCNRQIKILTCTGVAIAVPESGQYLLSLQGTTRKGQPIAAFPNPPTLSIEPPPLALEAFLNGQIGIINVKVNEPLTLNWNIAGGEGELKILTSPSCGATERVGSCVIGSYPQGGNYSVSISVADESRPPQTTPPQEFHITVIEPPPSSSSSPSAGPFPSASPSSSPPLSPPPASVPQVTNQVP